MTIYLTRSSGRGEGFALTLIVRAQFMAMEREPDESVIFVPSEQGEMDVITWCIFLFGTSLGHQPKGMVPLDFMWVFPFHINNSRNKLTEAQMC